MPVPQIPGRELSQDEAYPLIDRVAQLCHLESRKFPGSQPVSFAQSDLERLKDEDFWVCEKSDGVRVLLYIYCFEDSHVVFLIDRKNIYREQGPGFFFPHHTNPRKPMGDTIIDGELVTDILPNGTAVVRFLIFDALVIDYENIMAKNLESRYGRLQQFFYKPYAAMLKEFPHFGQNVPFQLAVKPMERAYGVEKVLASANKLAHKSDGLIYTSVGNPYRPFTDPGILKWKPPAENSVDFKLELKFPELRNTGQPDLNAKPYFALYIWEGGRKYSFYDTLTVEDQEWEEMKKSKVQYDDRVIEARWDFPASSWRFMRIRDDKPDGNHKDVVEKVVRTIIEPVHTQDLISMCPVVRARWKMRESNTAPPQRAPPLHPILTNIPSNLPFPGAPYYQGGFVSVGFAKVEGPTVTSDGWKR